jgi:hypothetical protein
VLLKKLAGILIACALAACGPKTTSDPDAGPSDGGTPDAGSPDAGSPSDPFVGTWYGRMDFGNGARTNWGPAVKVTATASDRVRIEYLTGGGYCPMTGAVVTAPCENCTPGVPHVTIDWSATCPAPSNICYEQSYTYIPTGFVLVTGGAKLTVGWRVNQTCNPQFGYDPTRRWVLSSDVLVRQ